MCARRYVENYWPSYPSSKPLEAKGGIKAQNKQGAFGQSWWAKRWIAVLESFNIGARLGRGRTYARKGQVLDIDIGTGVVTALVQGSRPKPYKIKIELNPLSRKDWTHVIEVLGHQALYTANLLAGEMPQSIEEVFTNAGCFLFPEKLKDLKTDCSCPDWSNPCKHIAAVYYLMGEEFDRDPFLLFRLRGMERDELLASLGSLPQEEPESNHLETSQTENISSDISVTDLVRFWQYQPLPISFGEGKSQTDLHALLIRQLGKFPFWRAAAPLLTALEPTYVSAVDLGLKVFLGEVGSEEPDTKN
jgi:uncharacterized Zn finger protein